MLLAVLIALVGAAPATTSPRPSDGCTGSWTVTSHPQVSEVDFLEAVSATSSTDVWAVGTHEGSDGYDDTMVQHWDGVAWTVSPSPTPGLWTFLADVSAFTPTDVWAVGIQWVNNRERTATLHWDGAAWGVVPSPNIGDSDNQLLGVEALAADDVWAVGAQYSRLGGPLILHWDGAAWSAVAAPHHRGATHYLRDVTAVSPTDVWAVGSWLKIGQSGPLHTLVEHWDGTAWSMVPSANVHWTHDNDLFGVTGPASGDVWAVGDYDAGATTVSTLAERWDGNAWSVSPSPNLSTNDVLSDVSADASTDVWGVGHAFVGGLAETLTERWDGVAWSIVPSPSPWASGTFLAGVAAVSPDDVWAVGWGFSGPGEVSSLIEHYC